MDGHSCGLERAPAGTADGVSPAGAVGTDIPLEKSCVSVDGVCDLMADRDGGLLETEMCVGFSKSISLGATKGLQKCATFPSSSGEAQQEGGSCHYAEMCVGFSKSISLGATKGLQKCATFPSSSGEAQQEGGSCHYADDGLKEAPAYERSMSLHPTLKLISAMKGSRQKNGMASPTENRHVKWAPDVYDPPVTSVCHSVTSSYQRRSKPRKKEKNKPKKKPKSRSKKNHQSTVQNSSVLQAPDLGLKGVSTSGDRSAPDDADKHEAMILDYSIGKQEAKCGSSFLRESVAKMHFSIAEAS